jgi:hypothetical protein
VELGCTIIGSASNFRGDGRVRRAAVDTPSIPTSLGRPSFGGRQWSGVATRGGADAFWPSSSGEHVARWRLFSAIGGRPLARITYCPLNCTSCVSLLFFSVLSCTSMFCNL